MDRWSSAEAYAPPCPITSFAGQDGGSRLRKEYLLECESIPNNYLSATAVLAFSTHEPSFFNTAPTFDRRPPLLPANNPYYVPFYQPPQYSAGLIERGDGVTLAGGGRIGVNLGQPTYFSSDNGLLSRSRAMCSSPAHLLSPRCQVEGCRADLSAAKHYHRRHKVCDFHSKASAVVAHGLHQRFCQQCSRFHVLAEFDEAKRSCRKRLADHNRRRRKPHLISARVTTPTAKSKGTTAAVPACPTPVGAQGTQLRDEQGLSQGRRGMGCNSMCQSEAVLIGAAVEEDKLSQQQQAQSFSSISESNCRFFHRQKDPGLNEALLDIGGDASSHRASLLHLGQSMFDRLPVRERERELEFAVVS